MPTAIIPLAFASGLNVYATVAVLGLCSRYGLVALPDQFRGFDHPLVIGVALTMYVVEFVADKIPWFDSAWDAVHTMIRPIGGAFIAVAALGEASPPLRALAALLGGSVAMTSHVTKAGTRAAANTSPEPFSNWMLSLGEDALAVALSYGALTHPQVALAVALALLVAIAFCASLIVRFVRRRCSGQLRREHARGCVMSDAMTNAAGERGASVRFPPPLVFLASTLLGVALRYVAGPFPPSGSWTMWLGVVILLGGLAAVVSARTWFVRTGQSPIPWKPSPELILRGPYRFTRNPMYVGITFVQAGLGLALGNLWISVLAPLGLLLVHFIAVVPEEAYLTQKFGAGYRDYCQRVRRYL